MERESIMGGGRTRRWGNWGVFRAVSFVTFGVRVVGKPLFEVHFRERIVRRRSLKEIEFQIYGT